MATPVRMVITSDSAEALRELVRREDLDLGCSGARKTASGDWRLEAYAPRSVAERLRNAGYSVEVDETLALRLAQRQQLDVGTGDRFEGGRVAPRGVGRKE